MTNKGIQFLKVHKKQVFLSLPIIYIGLLLILKALRYEKVFEQHALLSQIGLPSIGFLSPLECFLGSTLVLGIILNYSHGNGSWKKDVFWLPIIVYGGIAISLWLLAWAIKVLFFDSVLLFNFKNTVSLYPQVLLNLGSTTVLILCHYFGVQHLIRYMNRHHIPRKSRIIGILVGLLLGFITLQLLPIAISLPIALMIMLIILLLWDSYMDNRSSNLSWTLFLLLLYSIFPGVVFMKYLQQTTIEKGIVQARYIVEQLNQQTQAELKEDPYLAFESFADPGNPGFVDFSIIEQTQENLLQELKGWYTYESSQASSELVSFRINPNELQMVFGEPDGPQLFLFKPLYDFIEPIAISSLFFILLLISLFIIQFFSSFGLVSEGFTIFAIHYNSLSTRIQTGTIGTILISFILIGIVSFNFLQNSNLSNEDLAVEEIISDLEAPGQVARLIDAEIDENTISFLRYLVAAYAFLLSMAIVLAIFITNSITRPIASIGEKLSKLSLEENQRLYWDRQDEIGQLIDIYNQMIEKVEKQARQLKKSEREEAWREMAQQVAHEIKNPLTPMKLNVQYLMRAKDQQDPQQLEQLLTRISRTLIEQIDSLSRIATEFSNFAKMPKAQLATFSLNQSLQSVYNLYKDQQSDRLSIQLDLPEEEVLILADKEQLMRVINNLVKNGIQAIPEENHGKIGINLSRNNGIAQISVRDNGTGIPKELHEKVFVPNFTTKSSGTGLGLAISKNIVDAINGDIYFETTDNEGTIFYIDLPVLNVSFAGK